MPVILSVSADGLDGCLALTFWTPAAPGQLALPRGVYGKDFRRLFRKGERQYLRFAIATTMLVICKYFGFSMAMCSLAVRLLLRIFRPGYAVIYCIALTAPQYT